MAANLTVTINRRATPAGDRWDVRTYLPGGKYTSKRFASEKEAKAHQKALQRGTQAPARPKSQQQTVGELVKAHVERLNPSSPGQWIQLRNNLGSLEYMQAQKVTREEISAWREELGQVRPWAKSDRVYAASTIRQMGRLLSSVFNDALAEGLVDRNPTHRAKRLPAQQSAVDPRSIPTPTEVDAIIEAASEPISTMIATLAGTGVRAGELCGLCVGDFTDGPAASVYVHRQADGLYSSWSWKPLKTPDSIRTVPIGAKLAARLRDHVATLENKSPGAPLFVTLHGGQWSPSHLNARFVTAKAAADVSRRFTPHYLRHYFASGLIARGLNVNVVSKLLGHKSIAVTQEVYLHLWNDDHDRVRAALDSM